MKRNAKNALLIAGCVVVVCLGVTTSIMIWLWVNAPETNPPMDVDIELDESGVLILPDGVLQRGEVPLHDPKPEDGDRDD